MLRSRQFARVITLVAYLATGATGALAQAAQPGQLGFARTRLNAISDFFKAEVTAGRVPGVTILVQRRGQAAYFETFGVRDAATRAPMSADTLFRIYSMTKPITSVVAMMLVEDGRLSLDEPVAKYIPSFAQTKVGVEKAGDGGKPVLALEPLRWPITVHDLLRHTSGLAYGWSGHGLVHHQYGELRFNISRPSNAEVAERLAALPLSQHPGTAWEYGHSTDVLGRVIEVIEGKPLIDVFKERLLLPLGMRSTSFYVTDPAKQALIAEALPADGGAGPDAMFNPRNEMKWQAGGGGLVSTVGDYARFAQMIVNGGTLDGRRYLSPTTFAWMTANHVGPSSGISRNWQFLPGPGYGFGLGFAVRLEQGESNVPGSVGELYWGGAGGTYFWADPKEEMFVILMMQSYAQRDRYKTILRGLVYGALEK